MAAKLIHIIGGGTVSHVRNHLALAAPAYGKTARQLYDICAETMMERRLHLTKMAGGPKLETNEDIATLLKEITADPATKIVFMNAALVDFYGAIGFDICRPTPRYCLQASRSVQEGGS